ncbi:DUF4783 domain-containing protein [Mucilaginibacter sp. RB4R14]|uniref:DUF4783 domain-containing protein n=1 Tax=Mucilaginibacter aurantiaciroseus TaxID=2949308 RepID=UPI002090FC5B|nr:DUF4783 domain-containing protein [Mucilaginibacter aurantiaciroseus]MCO5936221.1 DUF4783 domain-containing protein [Mucilaginibacter aurantiaciroseus]
MMKLKHLPLLILLFLLPMVVKADTIDKITDLLKIGNAQEIAKYFAPNVDISITKASNSYSKTQAEMILNMFFKDNKPHTAKLLHRVNSNPNYNLGVYVLTTEKGKFRVSCTFKEVNKVMEIMELRIETEKPN